MRVVAQLPWILLLLIALSVAGAMIWTAATTPKDVEVPETNGASPEAAATSLINAGLIVGDSDEETSADVEEGKVIRTAPEAGATVKEGTDTRKHRQSRAHLLGEILTDDVLTPLSNKRLFTENQKRLLWLKKPQEDLLKMKSW